MIKALLACLLLVALAAALQECNVANCKTCTDPPKRCDQCSSTKTDPRILLADGSACKSCPPNCVACTEGAEGSTVCDTCMSFFYKLTDNTCTHCPGHCEKCSSTGVCSACESKYKMVSKDTTCTPCPTNCATCADSLTCWTCAAGYYLDKNGNCQACPGGADCSSCKDNTECLVCKDKKWDSTKKTCVACQSNCEICDTKDGCTKCKQGYFLSNDKLSCHSCKNCEGTCSDRTGCSKCEGGYHKIPDGRCAVCQDQYGSQEICEACRSSVRGQKWGTTCIYCPEYCEVCTDENTCVTCKTGYTKVGTTCKDCSTLSTLEVGGLQETDCGACSNLYFSSTCQVCPTTATDIDANADACSKCGNRIQNAKFQCKILECSTSAAKDYDATQCDICYKQGHKMYWTGDTCQTDYDCASLKSDATNKDKECMSCPNLWWNAATTTCEALICSSTEITNEIACQKCNKIFDSSGSPKCRDRPAGCSASTVQAECECLGWYWNGTQCTQQKDLSCENLTDLDSFSCEGCFRKFKEDTSVTTATQWLAVTPAANVCYRCHEGCDTCTATNGKVVCDTCLPGYSLIDSVCKKCPTGCYGCTADLKCASLNSKPACLDGFFESASTVCSACPPNCVGCTAADKCTKCAEGLIWDSNIGECVDCVFETSSECTSCLGSTSITGRYFDSSNLCKQCPVGCTKCSSDGTSCSECSSNYWLDTSLSPVRCTECPKDGGLASADTDKKCSVCGRTLNGGTGVFWNSAGNDGKGECTGCLANCQECTSTTSCRKCSGSRFFDTTSKTCKSCVSGCAECTNGDTCTKCITDKYFDTTSKTCISCDPKCNTTAAACDTVSGCTVCEKDHYLESQACKTCTDLDSNCLECSSKTQCTKCATRFYPKDDKCEACFKNCEVCDGKTCLTCAAGHCWDSSNKECFAKSGCKTCKSDDGVVTCMECESAHGLDICQPCSQANCLKCDADLAKCQNCAEGYYVTDSGSCSVCPGSTNCKSCSDNTKCSQCKDGFYWDSSSTPGNCVACGTNCLECSSGSTCTKCGRTGQYWDKTAKACKSCPTDCYECADGKSCNRCNNGTVWDVTDEVCTTCVKDCWNCKNATICKECLPGKYLTTGSTPSCESCGEGCLSCKAVNESVVCTTCSPGYLLNSNGGCDACDINSCTQCSDPSPHCSTCNSGFVLTSTKTCEVPCFKCSGAGCNKAQGVNDTVEPCPGLGSSHSCWITLTDTGGSVSYNRDCKASKCTSTAESCTKSGATTVCTKCCTTAKCNNGILQGHIKEVEEVDQGSAGSLKALGTLVVLMAVLLLL